MEKEIRGNRKHILFRFLRVTAWCLLGLILVLILSGLVLQTSWGGKFLLKKAGRIIEEKTGLILQASRVKVNIFKLKLSLQKVQLTSGPGASVPLESFSCERLVFQSGWSTITGGEVRIKNLEITGPKIKLALKKAAEEKKVSENAASGPFSFRIDRLLLTEGSLFLEEREIPLSFALSGLEASVVYQAESSTHRISLKNDSGTLEYGQGKLQPVRLKLEARLGRDDIRLEEFSLITEDSIFSLSGEIVDYDGDPGLKLKTTGHLSLSEIDRFLHPGNRVSGKVDWKLNLGGSISLPEIAGEIEGSALNLYGLEPVDVRLELKNVEKRTEIRGQVKWQESLALLEASLPPALKGRLSCLLELQGIDLSRLSVLVPEFPVEISSAASGRMELEAQEISPESLRGQLKIWLEPRRKIELPERQAGSALPVSGLLQLRYDGRLLEAEKINLKVPGARVDLRGNLRNFQQVEAKFNLRLDDVKNFIRTIGDSGLDETFGLEPALFARLSELGGSAVLEADVSGKLSSPYFRTIFRAQDLAFRQTGPGSMEIKASGDLSRIELIQFLLEFPRGEIKAEGKARALGPGGSMPLAIEGRLEISRVDLAQFAGLLPEGSRQYINGFLSGSANIGGTSGSPRVEFRVEVTEAGAETFKLERLELAGEYSPSEINLRKIYLKPEGEGQLEGYLSYRLTAGEIQAFLSGEKIKAPLFQHWLPSLKSGQVDLRVSTSGSLKNPVAEVRMIGQGIMLDRLWFPYVELKAVSDGKKARATVEVPRFNLEIEAGLEMVPPYNLSGELRIKDLPLSSLAGLLPEVEETAPLVALSAAARFSLPVEHPERLEAEFNFENFDFAGLAVLMPSLKSLKPGGRAGGRLELKGFSPDLDGVEARLVIPSLALELGGTAVENEGPLSLELKEKKLRVGNFRLKTGRSRLNLEGGAELGDPANPDLNFKLNADLELSDFNPWFYGFQAGGRVKLLASLGGDVKQPVIEGSGAFDEIFLRMLDLPIIVSNIRSQFRVDNSRMVLETISGEANSGRLLGSGEVTFGENFSLDTARLKIRVDDFDFNYPPGLNSVSQAELTLTKERQGWLLAGELSVLNASYRQDFYPSTQGLKLALSSVSPVGTEFPDFLYELGLNVNIKTEENIIIKNNLADLELKADLNLRGTIPAPILSGRIETAYPGELIIGERKYSVERLRVDFLGRENLEPTLDINLKSVVYDQEEEVEANLIITGTPSDLNFSLTSVPPRSEEDLASLLLTGKSLREVQGSALNTISGQLAQHFSSPLTSPVTGTLKKWLKAEDVILEPLNIATLQDPGARLTIRKRMTREFAVTYSIDLTNSQYQTWILDYQLRRQFSARGFRRDDGVLGLNLKHRIDIGKPSGVAEYRTAIRKKLSGIEITGDEILPGKKLSQVTRLKVGRSYRTSELRQAASRLEAFCRKKGYFNARIDSELVELNGEARLRINIRAGGPTEFKFSGEGIPRKVKNRALASWSGRLPEEANVARFKDILLNELHRRGYYQAQVELNTISDNDKTVYEINVARGRKWKIDRLILEGQPVFSENVIRKVVSDYFGARARGLWNLIYDTKIALELLEYFYQENGYLKPEIEEPVVEADSKQHRLSIVLGIEAGPRSRVESVSITGNSRFQAEELMAILNCKPGNIFSWPALNEDRTVLLNRYRGAGYKEAKVETRAFPVGEGPDYRVEIKIDEGPVYTVAELEVEGAKRTKRTFIIRESGLKEGEPVSLEKLAQAQKNLYDTAVFRSVTVTSVPEEQGEHRERVRINLREMPVFSLTYGLQYNTDTHFEGFTQFDFNNIFGRGWNSLLYFRANERQQNARASLKIPYVFSRKLDTLLSAFYLRDIKDLFITEEYGLSLQQKLMIVRGFEMSWIYRFSRIHDYEKEPSWPFPYDLRITSSEFSLLLSRDTRDDRFDPKRGSLLTGSFTYSPRPLGSDLNYFRSFTQFTMYRTLLPGVIWASCYRLGLGSAFGEVMIPSRRFFAGGGTSIRGFKLDAVGPLDIFTGLPEGGEAMLVINQELRFPIFSIFRGVAFIDAGNVYSRLSDFNPVKLRTGAGLGLRIESPLGLIRIDYGFNLKPRSGEPRGTLFVSIGQAF